MSRTIAHPKRRRAPAPTARAAPESRIAQIFRAAEWEDLQPGYDSRFAESVRAEIEERGAAAVCVEILAVMRAATASEDVVGYLLRWAPNLEGAEVRREIEALLIEGLAAQSDHVRDCATGGIDLLCPDVGRRVIAALRKTARKERNEFVKRRMEELLSRSGTD